MSRRITLRFTGDDIVYVITTVERRRICDHCDGKGRLRTLGKKPCDVVCLQCRNEQRIMYDVPIVQKAKVAGVHASVGTGPSVSAHYSLHTVGPATGEMIRRLYYKGLDDINVFGTDKAAMDALERRNMPAIPSRLRYEKAAREAKR